MGEGDTQAEHSLDGTRRIGHLDCDAFFASVELLRRPELKGKPVIVAYDGPRSVVTTATYEARAFGVGSAIPLSTAKRRCPQAVIIEPNFEVYKAASQQVMDILESEVSVVERMGLDEAYVDLSEVLSPKAMLRGVVSRILKETGLGISVGIGPNKLVAKLASDLEKPRGFTVLSRRDTWRVFADQSPRILPGVGSGTAEKLRDRGIETVRQLSAISAQELTDWFGPRSGSWLWHRARFECYAEVNPVRDPVSESRESTFSIDLEDRETQEAEMERLAGKLFDALESQGRRGRTVGIKVRLSDFTTVTRSRTSSYAIDDATQLAEIAISMLREYDPQAPVRLLGVRVGALELVDGPGSQLVLQL